MSVALVVNAVLIGGMTGTVAASDNEGPLADAGLDQSVTVNATVYLDATGSRDPDGEIAEYEWRLERPDGNYMTPDCETCARTSFVVRDSGTYNATVTVTDEEGATETDTLRVHVASSDGPSVTLSGPEDVLEGGAPTFSASAAAGESDLMAITWRVDDRRVNRTEVSGDSAAVDQFHAFRTDGEYTVRVTVTDRLGRQDSVAKNVTVREPTSSGNGGGDSGGNAATASAGEGDTDGEACSRFGRDDDRFCNNDRMTMDSNDITISDADNDGTTKWGGVTLDEEFAENNEGVSYDSIDGVVKFDGQESYKNALEVDSVNVNPRSKVNQNSTNSNEINVGDEDALPGDYSNLIPQSTGIGMSEKNGANENNNDTDQDGEIDSEKSGSETNTLSGRVPPDNGIPGGI